MRAYVRLGLLVAIVALVALGGLSFWLLGGDERGAQAEGGSGGAPTIVGLDMDPFNGGGNGTSLPRYNPETGAQCLNSVDDDLADDQQGGEAQGVINDGCGLGDDGGAPFAIDRCIAVPAPTVNNAFSVDIFLDDIPVGKDLGGFGGWLNYDATKLDYDSGDFAHKFLLMRDPDSDFLISTATDPAPKGDIAINAADMGGVYSAEQPGEYGVLGRYTLDVIGGAGTLTFLYLRGAGNIGPFRVDDNGGTQFFQDQEWDGEYTPVYGIVAIGGGDGSSCPPSADIKITGFAPTMPVPPEIPVSTQFVIPFQKTIHNNGPEAIPVGVVKEVDIPGVDGECEVSIHETEPGWTLTVKEGVLWGTKVGGVCNIVGPAGPDFEEPIVPSTEYCVLSKAGIVKEMDVHWITPAINPGGDFLAQENFDIHCYSPSFHQFEFSNTVNPGRIWGPADPDYNPGEIVPDGKSLGADPDPSNNTATYTYTPGFWALADLKVVFQEASLSGPLRLWDTDGDTSVDEDPIDLIGGPPPAESGMQCIDTPEPGGHGSDDDADTVVDDGCPPNVVPAVGPPEASANPNACHSLLDDDGDTVPYDGCPYGNDDDVDGRFDEDPLDIDVSQIYAIDVQKVIHNNGPYLSVDVDIDKAVASPAGCDPLAPIDDQEYNVQVGEDRMHWEQVAPVHCDQHTIGIEVDSDADTFIDEDRLGGATFDDDLDGLADEDDCDSIDDDADGIIDEDDPYGDQDCDGAVDEDSPFVMATFLVQNCLSTKDPHVGDSDMTNNCQWDYLVAFAAVPFYPAYDAWTDDAAADLSLGTQNLCPADPNGNTVCDTSYASTPGADDVAMDRDCIAGQPCKSAQLVTIPDGEPLAGFPMSIPADYTITNGGLITDGSDVGLVTFNVDAAMMHSCAPGQTITAYATQTMQDGDLPGGGNDDLPDRTAALGNPFSWSNAIFSDRLVRMAMSSGGVVWARQVGVVPVLNNMPINVITFRMPDNSWLRVVVVYNPDQWMPLPPPFCSPLRAQTLTMGANNLGEVLMTCDVPSPGPPDKQWTVNFVRPDTGQWTQMTSLQHCSPADTDASVGLSKDEDVGNEAPMSESGACDDGLDNDADGYVDLTDADCDRLGAGLPKEYPVTVEVTNGQGPTDIAVDLSIVSHDPCQADWLPQPGDTLLPPTRVGGTYTSRLQWTEIGVAAFEVRQAVRNYSLNCTEPGTFSGAQAIQVTATVVTTSLPDPNPGNNEATNQVASIIALADIDGDTVPNAVDNCPLLSNSDQANTDGDLQGNACDGDDDNDTILDPADNCPLAANPGQEDIDGDGLGDACDPDNDNDTVPDVADNCPLLSNSDQTNTDGDSLGDACDPDDDNDTVLDGADNCPLVANGDQANADGDPLGNACDPDDDNDGFPDEQESSLGSNPLDAASTPEHSSVSQTCFDGQDNDRDGWTDGYDLGCDYDADGIPNFIDACVALAEDWDGYQDGDGCPEADNDMDGVCDPWYTPSLPACTGSDSCPNVAEDVDSFHDSNGCPDPDNDSDGFPDHTDQCPATDWTAGPDGDPATLIDNPRDEYGVPIDTREDYDGIIDVDGCHDSPGDDWDGDGIADEVEAGAGIDPMDMDSDDDGLCDGSAPPVCGSEDLNNNGIVNPGETDPLNPDSDGDGLSDGLEMGLAEPETPGTNVLSSNWQPDSDPSTTSDPLDPDTDGDSLTDGVEDADQDGRTDPGETSPSSGDTDADGYGDTADNCPAANNPGQEDFEVDGIGDRCDDSDTDGFTDYAEFFVGTDPLDSCPDGPGDDVWPPDNTIDSIADVSDVLSYVRLEALNTAKGYPGYVVRLDMTADDVVDVSDVLGFIPYLNTVCSQ